MPIKNFELVGNWNNSAAKRGWDNKDIGILTRDKAVDKIKRKFAKCDHTFNFYFARHKNGRDLLQSGEMTDDRISYELNLDGYKSDEEAINVIFTQNIAADRVPMTAWTIAHRLGHVFREVKGFDYMFEAYEAGIKKIANAYDINFSYFWNRELCGMMNQMGTMRSCRMNRINRAGEFAHELVAQSIITGGIKFNHLEKRVITRRRFAWGHPIHEYAYIQEGYDLDDVNMNVDNLADITHCDIDMCLSGVYGKTLVM